MLVLQGKFAGQTLRVTACLPGIAEHLKASRAPHFCNYKEVSCCRCCGDNGMHRGCSNSDRGNSSSSGSSRKPGSPGQQDSDSRDRSDRGMGEEKGSGSVRGQGRQHVLFVCHGSKWPTV